jgi:hypothetical protein
VSSPRLPGTGARQGRIDVTWTAEHVSAWRLDSAPAGTGAWTRRASGTTAQSASLRLPAGRTYDLRLVSDAGVTAVGRVVVPIDIRRWAVTPDRNAWRGTTAWARKGASAAFALAAGRPVLLVRGGHGRIAVGAKTFRVTARTRTLTGAPRAKRGAVRVRVLSGRIGLDGIAVAR